MRIEWLDKEMKSARVTVGWFRKRTSEVRLTKNNYDGEYVWWHITITGESLRCGWWLTRRLNSVRDQVWTPVAKLPEARMVAQ